VFDQRIWNGLCQKNWKALNKRRIRMPDHDAPLRKTDEVPEAVRIRAICKCYAFILSLPDPRGKSREPAAKDLSGEEVEGLDDETLIHSGETTLVIPEEEASIGG
jgi:hypothetical protein